MASTALEEKINKIRLRNEEIKRRYEEVEADKKNAAKLDALVEPAPSEDWPERKEPPEFSASAPKHTNRQKHPVKKHNDQSTQYYTGSGEGKKAHNFGDGQGPPPDPKYNFLADSERDEHGEETPRDTERNRGRGKPTRGVFKRRGSGRDWHAKEQWNQQGSPGDATRPDYEAWRAERNRIDEARISRQRTAEGNWRREWDNDKVHLADEVTKRDRVTLGDVVTRQEHGDNEKLYRSPRTSDRPRNSQHANSRDSYHGSAVPEAANKVHGSNNEPEKRVVIATDRNIKVMLNPGSTPPKSSVMSVKVSQPNIAGTGRVGPRQRPRVMYSSQSEAEASPHDSAPAFTRQKSVDERTAGRPFEQTQKTVSPKSPHPQRKRDSDPKSPYPKRRDNDRGDKVEGTPRSAKKDAQKSPYPQRRGNATGNYPPKSPRVNRRSTETGKNDFPKSPRAPQDRNRVKRNASSVSEESKGESSDGDVLAAVDSNESSSVEKSNQWNQLPSNFDSDGKTINENVPTKQSPPEEASDSAEVDSKLAENCREDIAKNDNEEESTKLSKMSTEEMVQENNAGNNKTIQTPSEEAPDSEVDPKSGENCRKDSAKNDNEEESSKLSKISTEEIVNENNAENNKTIQTPSERSMNESPVEISANAIEENMEPEKNRVDETKTDDKCSDQVSSETSINPVEEISDVVDNKTPELKETQQEASGSRESKDSEAGSSSNKSAINCSANSGLNDSGFLELQSNDSIHNVSGNSNAATSDFAETSVDSVQSENETVENRAINENSEEIPKVAEGTVENVAEPSIGRSENKEKELGTDELKAVEKISQESSDVGNILSTQKESERNEAETINTPNEAENSMQKTVIEANKSDSLEKNSVTSNAHKEPEENAKLMENDKTDLEVTQLKSQEKEIVKSVDETPENNSNPSTSKDTNFARGEKAAEAINAQEIQNESNESKIILENSNNVEEITQSAADGQNKDSAQGESASISKSSNDINKENNVESATAESLSSMVAGKVDENPN